MTGRAAPGTFDVHDPADGRVIASLPDQGPAEAIAALDAACAAQQTWVATPPRRRSEVLYEAYRLVVAATDELADLVTHEMGKTLAESRAEVAYGAEFLRWFAEETVRIRGMDLPAPGGGARLVTRREAVGPCLLITPWNFPLAMATRKIAPALAAGCTMVIKPSELAPLTTIRVVELLRSAGLPDHVVNVVTTTRAADTVGPLLTDPRLRKLSFTGSTAVGKQLLRASAENILRTSMELGGNAPFIVLDDADLDAAVAGALVAKLRNSGQACTAANRFLVHSAVVDDFSDRLVEAMRPLRTGPGLAAGTDVGPLIDGGAATKVAGLVDDAVARGATIVLGGEAPPGRPTFFPPTVLVGVDPDSAIAREEIFGPVVAVTAVDSDAEAVRLANRTPYGLAAYLYASDPSRVLDRADGLQAGMIGVNTGLISNVAAPFGGVKHSGLGREGGAEGIDEYLTTTYLKCPAGIASSQ